MRSYKSAVEAAEHVWNALVAGKDARVVELGAFTVREYKAFEGRDPRTGATVHVASRRLPFFKLDKVAREFTNGSAVAPRTAWIAAMLAQLGGGRPVAFGRTGAFRLRSKPEAVGHDPASGRDIVIPARTVVSFTPSSQFKRVLNGEPALRQTDSAAITAVLARLPVERPTTLAELQATLAHAGVDHVRGGVVPPGQVDFATDTDGNAVVGLDVEGDPQWYSSGNSVFQAADDEPPVEYPVASWARDMLVVAAVRAVARGQALSGEDVQRVFALLDPEGPFSVHDLPF